MDLPPGQDHNDGQFFRSMINNGLDVPLDKKVKVGEEIRIWSGPPPPGQTLIPVSPPCNFIILNFHVQQLLSRIQKTWNFFHISGDLYGINTNLDFLGSNFEKLKKALEQECWKKKENPPTFERFRFQLLLCDPLFRAFRHLTFPTPTNSICPQTICHRFFHSFNNVGRSPLGGFQILTFEIFLEASLSTQCWRAAA